MREIKFIFVHCTATSQQATVEQLMQGFRRRGWRYPGYHYIITPEGDTVNTLDERTPSNGVRGWNANAVNIAYIGGIDRRGEALDNRTIEQKASLVHLLLQLRERYPKARIMGHRDIWGACNRARWRKECPSFNATREYAAI
mgnify:CR=1 FL=1